MQNGSAPHADFATLLTFALEGFAFNFPRPFLVNGKRQRILKGVLIQSFTAARCCGAFRDAGIVWFPERSKNEQTSFENHKQI